MQHNLVSLSGVYSSGINYVDKSSPLTDKNPRKFLFGGYVTLFVQLPKSLSKPTNPICPEQYCIDERSNPTSPPTNFTTNNMN